MDGLGLRNTLICFYYSTIEASDGSFPFSYYYLITTSASSNNYPYSYLLLGDKNFPYDYCLIVLAFWILSSWGSSLSFLIISSSIREYYYLSGFSASSLERGIKSWLSLEGEVLLGGYWCIRFKGNYKMLNSNNFI